MKVIIAGIGMGTLGTLTGQVACAICDADFIMGSKRALELAHDVLGDAGYDAGDRLDDNGLPVFAEAIDAATIVAAVEKRMPELTCILCSGDIGFFSLSKTTAAALRRAFPDVEIQFLPGISTVQYLAAKLGRRWQDCTLLSAHGRDCDVIGRVLKREQVFLLTGGDETPMTIIERLVTAGLGNVEVTVGERLSYDDESIVTDKADNLCGQEFDPLSAIWISHGLLCEREVAPYVGHPGIPDELFIRGDIPMTKSEIRAFITAHVRPAPSEVIWDIGAGTGSVSVELACAEPYAQVFAIDKEEAAVALVEQNRKRFGAFNVQTVFGQAPEVFAGLPAPDAVFVGGSTGELEGIMNEVLAANPQARILTSAVTMETIAQTTDLFERLVREGRLKNLDIWQVAVTRTRETGRYHLMDPESPIFLFQAHGVVRDAAAES